MTQQPSNRIIVHANTTMCNVACIIVGAVGTTSLNAAYASFFTCFCAAMIMIAMVCQSTGG